MVNYRVKIRHKLTKEIIAFSFSIASIPGDCGTRVLSGFYGGIHSKLPDIYKAILFSIKRAVLGNGGVGHRKLIMSYTPIDTSSTYKIAKILRVKTIKSKGAHGDYDFHYGIKTFDLSDGLGEFPKKLWEYTEFKYVYPNVHSRPQSELSILPIKEAI